MKESRDIIKTEKLTKVFKVAEREKTGLLAALRSLFRRQYKLVGAVKDLDLVIRSGEIRGLIGPNGAGKSTTLKMLSGILHPTAGRAEVIGYTPWKQREKLVRRLGVVFGQKTQLVWDLPALDTFQLARKVYDIPAAAFKENLAFFIEMLKAHDIVKKPVRQLSLGERMKCEFICALLHEPPLVFLDEPTIGLDIFSKEAIRAFIKGVNREKGTTFILTTHDLSDIENLCGRVSIINQGGIVFDDTIAKLKGFFTDRKIVELQFQRKVAASALRGYNVKSFTPWAASIELDVAKTRLDKAVAGFFRKLPVRDINISSIDIEEVIKFIYAGQGNVDREDAIINGWKS